MIWVFWIWDLEQFCPFFVSIQLTAKFFGKTRQQIIQNICPWFDKYLMSLEHNGFMAYDQ